MSARTCLLINEARPTRHDNACGNGVVSLLAQASPLKNINEDCAAAFQLSDEHCVLAVADGVGGAPRGHDASRLAIEALAECLPPLKPCDPIDKCIARAFALAQQRIASLGVGAATTLSVVSIKGRTLRSFHAGDSGCFITGQRGKLKLKTVFHSPVGYAEQAGLISEDEALCHPQRHVVSNLLGIESWTLDSSPPLQLAPRDTVVLASDGLFDNIRNNELADLVRTGSLSQAAGKLHDFLNHRMTRSQPGQPGKPDDLSFVLFRLGQTRTSNMAAKT